MNPQDQRNKTDAQRNNPAQKPGVSPQGEKSKTQQQKPGVAPSTSRPGSPNQERY